jgi:hypothetical protein
MERIPWTEQEDEVIRQHYASANGAMTPYQQMADELNQRFHGGKNVRKVGAVCRRDGVVNFGK